MKRSWLVLAALVVVGGLAGIAIAGRPTSIDTAVIRPATTVESTPTSPASTTSVVPSTTSAPAAATTSTNTPTTSTTEPTVDRAALKLLVANGANRPGIASATADRLISLGYEGAQAVNALRTSDVTTVFMRPGFELAAAAVAADLNLTADRVQPLPAEAITDRDSDGHVIVVIGGDYAG